MKYTAQQILEAAEGACFYVTPGGLWLRMFSVDRDEGSFWAIDEDSGEDFQFVFDEMIEQGEDPEFHHLTRTKIEGTENTEWFEP